MKIKLANHYKSCISRVKGKKIYDYMTKSDDNEFFIDFTEIVNISISFLDESIWRLIREGKKVNIYDPDNVLKEKLNLIQIWRPLEKKMYRKNLLVQS